MAARARFRLLLPVLLALPLSLLAVPVARAGVLCAGEPATHVGTAGPDVLTGTAGPDVFVGRGGDDRLIGRGGNDLFCAGGGDDVVKGGGGDDTARGQGGADTLVGGPGDDTLLGGGGDDTLNGGDGSDTLNGGRGTDECTAGEIVRNCEGPATGFEVDGSWAGLTSQDADITFEVAEHELTTITIIYSWNGPGCFIVSTTTVDFPNGLAIVNNAFHIEVTVDNLVIDGTFTSDTEATGTFSASDPSDPVCPGGAKGTWTATKQ